MLKSMTGYGRCQRVLEGRDISVEIKSVNHRFFEFSARVPRAYGYLEEKMKSFVQQNISRGKIEVNITVFTLEGKDAEVEINKSLAKGYIDALRSVADELDLTDNLSLNSVLRFQDVFSVRKTQDDEEVIWSGVKQVAEEAICNFVSMRTVEGERLKADIEEKLDSIEQSVGKVEELSPKTTAAYRERLYTKLCEVLENTNIDENRILTEAAIFAEKTAVDEETVRLKSHIAQFRTLINGEEPVGRKLDFLVQEMNREINTIGSKAQDIAVAKIVVDVKSDIEKIREQIQNVE